MALVIEEQGVKLESTQQFGSFSNGHPSFVGGVVKHPEGQAAELFSKKVITICLFVRGCDVVLVDCQEFIKGDVQTLQVGKISVPWMDQLCQVLWIQRHRELVLLAVLTMELHKVLSVNAMSLMVL